MRYLEIWFICLLTMVAAACGPTPGMTIGMAKKETAKLRPEYKKFIELCEAANRSVINKSISVDGYLYASTSGSSCSNLQPDLFDSNYKYIECSENKINDYNSLMNSHTYHYAIKKNGKNNCIPTNELSTEFFNKNSNRLEKECLAREKNNKPESNYAYLYENGYMGFGKEHILFFPNDRLKKNLITFSGEHLINIRDLKTIAIKRNYTYWPEGINMQIKYACESQNSSIIIEDIFIPK